MIATPSAAPLQISGVAHLTLPVSDLELAERFYVDLLGLTLSRRFDRETFLRLRPDRETEADADQSPLHLELRCGGLELDLFLCRGHRRAPPRPHPHLAFEVDAADLPRFMDRLRAAGVPVDGPRHLGPPGHASIYFADPFGNLLELSTMGYPGELEVGPPAVHSLGHAFEGHASAREPGGR